MSEYAVLFLMLGLAVMALQQILVKLLGLRGRALRSALCELVRAVKFPTGFREDRLVDRVLADRRIDPLSPTSKPTGAVTGVTRVDATTLVTVLRDTLASASPDMLVDGFAKRPDSVRVEIRQVIESLSPKVVEHVRSHFEGAMTACADRYKMTMRVLSVLLGAPCVFLVMMPLGESRGVTFGSGSAYSFCALGVVLVPVLAGVWYGLLTGVAKFRSAAEGAALTARRSTGGRTPRRGGKSGGSSRSTPSESSGGERSAAAGSGGGGGRRKGRRSSGRRGGRRSGGGGGESPSGN